MSNQKKRNSIVPVLTLLALVVFATACAKRAPLPAISGSYPTPRVAAGFGQPATPVPTATRSPTSAPAATANAGVTPNLAPTSAPITVVVTQTVVVAAPTATAVVPTFVPTPTSPPATGIHCDNPSATITSPPMNAEIHGTIPVSGTATIADLAFYKVQYMPDVAWGSEKWGELYQSTKPVVNGNLLNWDTTTVEPGVYWLRLLVTHTNGQYGDPCEVRVTVVP
jgi:hypothetical protein